MEKLINVVSELLIEYSKKRNYKDLHLENENPESIIEAIEQHYGNFTIKNFQHALRTRSIFTSKQNYMAEFFFKAIEKHFFEDILNEEFIKNKIDEIIEKYIISKNEAINENAIDFEQLKKDFKENLMIGRKVFERKNKKISFAKGNGANNIQGRVVLSKGDLNFLEVTPENKEYDLIWLSDGSIIIKPKREV